METNEAVSLTGMKFVIKYRKMATLMSEVLLAYAEVEPEKAFTFVARAIQIATTPPFPEQPNIEPKKENV